MERQPKEYLGDSVYVDIVNGMIQLTTDNGYGPSNTIYMENKVLVAFLHWIGKETGTQVRFTQVEEEEEVS